MERGKLETRSHSLGKNVEGTDSGASIQPTFSPECFSGMFQMFRVRTYEPNHHPCTGELPSIQILLADSNKHMQEVVAKIFGSNRDSLKVDVVDCTDDILRYAKGDRYACILLDLRGNHFKDAVARIRSSSDATIRTMCIFGRG